MNLGLEALYTARCYCETDRPSFLDLGCQPVFMFLSRLEVVERPKDETRKMTTS